jgi:hypothetical protein
MSKYRIKEYDILNNIYLLQERFLLVFWRSISVGSKEKLENFINTQGK